MSDTVLNPEESGAAATPARPAVRPRRGHTPSIGEGGGAALASASDPDASWRERLAAVEARAAELERDLAEARVALDRAAAETREREERSTRVDLDVAVDAALAAAGVVDAETVRALLGTALETGADLANLLGDLRRRKPFLFRSPARPATAAQAPARPEAAPTTLPDLARDAQRRGDRPSLLRYLRARRER